MEKRLQKRSIVAVFLIFALSVVACLSVLFAPRTTVAKAEVSTWDGDLIAAGWGNEQVSAPAEYNDNGLTGADRVITIGSAAAFAWFAHEVYKDTTHTLDQATVKLTVDIDLDNHMWIPIGQTNRTTALANQIRFSGTFDGGNHTISNFNTEEYVKATQYVSEKSGNYQVYTYSGPSKGYSDNKAYIPFTAKGDISKDAKLEYSYGLFGIAYDITIKNLKLDNVKIDLGEFALNGKSFLTDSIGAIVGYATGNITIDNCTVGSTDHTKDNKGKENNTIKLRDDDGGAAAGIIGRLYAYDGNAGAFTKFAITNCVNYLNIDTADTKLQTGGMVGLIDYGKTGRIERCVNYGNITGGNITGGIIGTWTPSNTKVSDAYPNGTKTTDYCWIMDCDNYGNVYSKTAKYVGGIIGEYYDNMASHIKFIADGNVNYGNVGGAVRVGGVFGTTDPNLTGALTWSTITNNFNYGDVYSFDAECVGGYIGYEGHTSFGSKSYVISGGNFGIIYGSATFKGQNFGGANRTGNTAGGPAKDDGSVVENAATKKAYLIAGGEMIAEFDSSESMPAPKYTEAVANRYLDVVSRKREDDDSNYKYTDKYEFIYDYTYTDDTFAYSDNTKTTIIGIKDGAEINGTVTIPSTVTKIGFAAFTGHKEITAIDLANSKVSVIEDAAFAGTGIETLVLPSTPISIGNGAFASIDSLNYVTLPANASGITLGKKVFAETRTNATREAEGAFIIATGSAQYDSVAGTFENSGGVLTYKITIRYEYEGRVIDSEERLRGQSYSVVYSKSSDMWEEKDLGGRVGPASVEALWRVENDESSDYIYSDTVDDWFIEIKSDVVTLYGFAKGTGAKIFIAKSGIVYDKSKSYGQYDINQLLHPESDLMESDEMEKVVITKDGDSTPVDVIHDAGTYTITIGTEYEFDIKIEKAEIDLASLSYLEWRIEGSNAQLMSDLLYIYDNNTPSRTIKTSGTLTAARQVEYSIVRQRLNDGDTPIDVSIVVYDPLGDNTFSVDGNYTGNKYSAVGVYTASVKLVPGVNYTFKASTPSKTREMTIALEDGNATVTKTWYIVAVENMLVSGTSEYTIRDFAYGDKKMEEFVSAPALRYGEASEYVTMTLYRQDDNGNWIKIGDSFKTNEFTSYINRVMPAGNYRLEVSVDKITIKGTGSDSKTYEGFTETITFTVNKAQLPSPEDLGKLYAKITGQPFAFATPDLNLSLVKEDELVAAYLTALNESVNLSRRNTVWANYDDEYDEYNFYGEYGIMFNLAGSRTDAYTSTLEITDPGVYHVYYKIYVPNYVDSTEGDARTSYYIKVILMQEIVAPVPLPIGYNGEAQKADVAAKDLYFVEDYDGYTDVGTHIIRVTLTHPDYCYWEGMKLGEKTKEITFDITRVENEWIETPDVIRWVQGQYDPDVNVFTGVARFGSENITYVITDKNGTYIFNEAEGINKLAKAKAGKYKLIATIAPTDNFYTDPITVEFEILKKAGLPWWAVLVVIMGTLGLVALVIFLLLKFHVFEILTEKLTVAIRTRASVEATIASVRAAKRMEEGRKSVAAAKRREKMEERRQNAKLLTPEERAAKLEARLMADEARAERLRARIEANRERAAKMRVENAPAAEAAATDNKTEE